MKMCRSTQKVVCLSTSPCTGLSRNYGTRRNWRCESHHHHASGDQRVKPNSVWVVNQDVEMVARERVPKAKTPQWRKTQWPRTDLLRHVAWPDALRQMNGRVPSYFSGQTFNFMTASKTMLKGERRLLKHQFRAWTKRRDTRAPLAGRRRSTVPQWIKSTATSVSERAAGKNATKLRAAIGLIHVARLIPDNGPATRLGVTK